MTVHRFNITLEEAEVIMSAKKKILTLRPITIDETTIESKARLTQIHESIEKFLRLAILNGHEDFQPVSCRKPYKRLKCYTER